MPLVIALLRDRSLTARRDQVLRAVRHVARSFASSVVDVRHEDGRRGVRQSSRGDVPGHEAGRLRLLQDRRQVLIGPRGRRDPAVARLRAGRPRGAGRGGVGHVVGQGRVVLQQRVRGHLSGGRQDVHHQMSGGADGVVARQRDLRIAHPVTDQQDDVAEGSWAMVPLLVRRASHRGERHRERQQRGAPDERESPDATGPSSCRAISSVHLLPSVDGRNSSVSG